MPASSATRLRGQGAAWRGAFHCHAELPSEVMKRETLSHADAAGIVLGARVPIIITSRADQGRWLPAVAALLRHSQIAKQPIRA